MTTEEEEIAESNSKSTVIGKATAAFQVQAHPEWDARNVGR